ncbi:MAG: hypothetical protein SOZ01_01860, partial [Selenomonadaceae bacterium]|nr:hypothetical protein [Selenomonadaceae bacterium]
FLPPACCRALQVALFLLHPSARSISQEAGTAQDAAGLPSISGCRIFRQQNGAGSATLCGKLPISSDNYPLWEGIGAAPAAGFMQEFPLSFLPSLCYTGDVAIENNMKQIRNDLLIVSNAKTLWHKVGGEMMAGINELMKRYNITTAQGMTRTIRVHLDELNADGEHARKIGKEWQLDAVAIRRLDSIRGLSKSEAIQNLENAEIRSLNEEVKNLNVALLHAQNEALEAHKQVQQAQKQVLQAQAAVLQEKDRIIAMQNQKAAAETKAVQNEVRIEAMQQELDRQAKELQQARQDRDRMTHASLWQRIMRRW